MLLLNRPPVFGWLLDPEEEKRPPVGFEKRPVALLENKLSVVFENRPLPLVVGALPVNKFENRLPEVGFASYFFC